MKTKLAFPGIYEIVHTASGKRYIGNSRNVANRIYAHRYALRNNRHFCPYLQNAWNKHGESAFEFKLIERCFDEVTVLLSREQYWIDKNLKRLYNSRKFSEQFIQDWYRTDESIPTRRKAAERMREYRANLKRELVCGQCKEPFVTNNPSTAVRFCSAKCHSRFKHVTKAYTIDMICKQCGVEFKGYPHKTIGFCSRKCSKDSLRIFSQEQVIDILTRIAGGDTVKNLASELNTTTRVIGKIAGGVTYADIELPEWLSKEIEARRLKNRTKRHGYNSSSSESSRKAS